MIRQRNEADSEPAAPRRSRNTAAPIRRLRQVLGGVTRYVNERWPQSDRRSVRPAARPVIREPESAWWDQDNDQDDVGVTVAVVDEPETGRCSDALISRLAELAVRDELLVVCGSGVPSGHHAVVAGLRRRLPRHHLITLHVDHRQGGLRRDTAAALEQFLEDGNLSIVVTATAAVPTVTAQVSSYLRVDRVLRMGAATRPALTGTTS